ncbi:MAG: Na/Pi cotransporter family protein [Deltaproteobacteria bacterium]|nr:Na/Pi cotransporter family protein [Deltaproteobacteria bacterium]
MGTTSPDILVGEEKPYISRYIANAHTMFNVINAIIFLSILPYLVKVATWLTPSAKDEKLDELYHIRYLDRRFVDSPEVALLQARLEIVRMGDIAQTMFDDVVNALRIRNSKNLSTWKDREDILDNFQKEITDFLVRVMQDNIIVEESKELASLMRMSNNLEKIGDEAEDIAIAIEAIIDDGFYFSSQALQDYVVISSEVSKFLALVIQEIEEENVNIMPEAVTLVNNVNQMAEQMRSSHYSRLMEENCEMERGAIFIDILNALEKISDFCYNVAQAVAGVK